MANKLILVVDNHDDAARLMAELVQRSTSFDAVAAKNGQEALNLARRQRPDAAILEIDLPHIGGLDLARTFRAEFGERRPLLIAVTGAAEMDNAQLSGLFDHVFRKPIGAMSLLRVLAEA